MQAAGLASWAQAGQEPPLHPLRCTTHLYRHSSMSEKGLAGGTHSAIRGLTVAVGDMGDTCGEAAAGMAVTAATAVAAGELQAAAAAAAAAPDVLGVECSAAAASVAAKRAQGDADGPCSGYSMAAPPSRSAPPLLAPPVLLLPAPLPWPPSLPLACPADPLLCCCTAPARALP